MSHGASSRGLPWFRPVRLRRALIVASVAGLLIGILGPATGRYHLLLAGKRIEARVVAKLRAQGAQVEDQVADEIMPLGRLFPGTGAAHYRLAIKLRNPRVRDQDLADLDLIDPDRVRSLDLLNCAIGDATLARAARFTNLTLLGIGQARNSAREPWPTRPAGLLSEAGFAELDHLTELETVGLHGPDVTDAALKHLSRSRGLRVLILYGTRVTRTGLAALGRQQGLVTLKLGGTPCGDRDLDVLEHFPALETLDLRDTAVTGAGLERLKVLRKLKRLCLEGCDVSDAAIDALIRQRPGLVVDRPSRSRPSPRR